MIQSILEESDGNDDEYDQGRHQQKHRKGQGAAHDNFTSPAPMKPVRGGKKHQTEAQKGKPRKNDNAKSAAPSKDPSFVNYAYEDHSGLDTSQVSQKMSPKVLLANTNGVMIPNSGINFGAEDDYDPRKHRNEDLSKSINDNSFTHNDQGLDTSLQHSAIDPDTMFQGNLLPSNFYQKNRNSKTMTQRHSNIEKIRKTARNSAMDVSQVSASTPKGGNGQVALTSTSSKQFKTLKQFLDEMFTDQFVQFTNSIKRLNVQLEGSDDLILQDRFKQNEQLLTAGSSNDPLPFPKNFAERYPFQLREVFESMHTTLKKRELLAFLKGTLYSEKIINMYFKILEKMNLVQLSMDNYQRQQQMMQETPDGGQRHSISSHLLLGSNTMKIQYLTTNFVRKLRLQNPDLAVNGVTDTSFDLVQQTDQQLMQYFNHDLVLLPFFFDKIDTRGDKNAAINDNHKHVFQKNTETGEMEATCGCSDEKRAILVSVKVLDNQVDLFDKEFRENDSKYSAMLYSIRPLILFIF